MIKELHLDEHQLKDLARKIADLHDVLSDVEVLAVQDEGDCFKAFYNLEVEDGSIRAGSIYFRAQFRHNCIEDFEEIVFRKQ